MSASLRSARPLAASLGLGLLLACGNPLDNAHQTTDGGCPPGQMVDDSTGISVCVSLCVPACNPAYQVCNTSANPPACVNSTCYPACASSERCVSSGSVFSCVPGSSDAGNNDAGNNDAGNNDAGNNDAGNNDAGNNDAGNSDAGNSDAGNNDAGDNDAGNRDAGNNDAGNSDAGNSDAGNRDAGNNDAGNNDAGTGSSFQIRGAEFAPGAVMKSAKYQLNGSLAPLGTTALSPNHKIDAAPPRGAGETR